MKKNIKIKIAVASHCGRRRWNEDNFYTGKKTLIDQEGMYSISHKIEIPSICAVCDGMGGLADGKEASDYAVTYIKQFCEDKLLQKIRMESDKNHGDNISAWISRFINDLNVCMNRSSKKFKEYGSTLAMLYLAQGKVYTANVGDSRIYAFKEKKLEKLSVEHTQRASAIRLGMEPIDDTWGNNVLTQYLGVPSDSMILEPHIMSREYSTMTLLVCSDGLLERLNEEEIHNIFLCQKGKTLRTLSKEFVKKAISKETKDNVTVMLIKIVKR